MSASELFLATVLLSAPVGTPEQTPEGDRWKIVQGAVHAVAVEWEILDPREKRHILVERDDFQADLDFLRKRKADLEDAPRADEANRLPDQDVIDESIAFNREYRQRLAMRLVWEADRAHVIGEAIRETDRLFRVWCMMRDAQCEFQYVNYRRLALKKLQLSIGEEAFAAGEWPPCVPEWSFAELR